MKINGPIGERSKSKSKKKVHFLDAGDNSNSSTTSFGPSSSLSRSQSQTKSQSYSSQPRLKYLFLHPFDSMDFQYYMHYLKRCKDVDPATIEQQRFQAGKRKNCLKRILEEEKTREQAERDDWEKKQRVRHRQEERENINKMAAKSAKIALDEEVKLNTFKISLGTLKYIIACNAVSKVLFSNVKVTECFKLAPAIKADDETYSMFHKYIMDEEWMKYLLDNLKL